MNTQRSVYDRFVCLLMRHGHKSCARKILATACGVAQAQLGNTVLGPKEIVDTALLHVHPLMEVRSVRVGGSKYQVPALLNPGRRTNLGLTWLKEGAKNRGGSSSLGFAHMLGLELADAVCKQGYARRKRDEMHKLVEANRAYMHYRWW